MPCYTPLGAHELIGEWAPNKPNGKKTIIFGDKPLELSKPIQLPCGQCIGCRLQQSIMWATRIMNEIQTTKDETACFLTLTYNDKNLPKDGSLNKEHPTLFLKKLRKAIEPEKIRFFLAGEYGDESWRPHYHLIIMGYDFSKPIIYQKTACQGRIQYQEGQTENPYYLSEFVQLLWNKGNHVLTNCTFETAAYVARYCTKKINGDKADQHYNRLIIDWNEFTGEINNMQETNLLPEYATMSRGRGDNKGIGYQWYQQYKSDCYPSGYTIKDGHKVPIPKYYDNLLFEEDEYLHATMKAKKILAIQENYADYTPGRLRERLYTKQQQFKSLKRSL